MHTIHGLYSEKLNEHERMIIRWCGVYTHFQCFFHGQNKSRENLLESRCQLFCSTQQTVASWYREVTEIQNVLIVIAGCQAKIWLQNEQLNKSQISNSMATLQFWDWKFLGGRCRSIHLFLELDSIEISRNVCLDAFHSQMQVSQIHLGCGIAGRSFEHLGLEKLVISPVLWMFCFVGCASSFAHQYLLKPSCWLWWLAATKKHTVRANKHKRSWWSWSILVQPRSKNTSGKSLISKMIFRLMSTLESSTRGHL